MSFPVRSVTLFHDDRWGLSSLATERFDYVRREVQGYCLDVGCGRHNCFVTEHLGGNGVGIDVFPYDGLRKHQVLRDLSRFPFEDGRFDSVTFIANLNHVPEPLRDVELPEAYRCLRPGGNVIVTMGNPLAEVLVHKVVAAYDRLLGTRYDVDGERGMEDAEDYYLRDREIRDRLTKAGFTDLRVIRFWTQFGLNRLYSMWKPSISDTETS